MPQSLFRILQSLAKCFPLLCLMLVAFTFSCSPSLPSGVLSEDDMEDLLYDMHVAQVVYETREGKINDADIVALRQSVLRKYDVTEAEWDSSFNYYCHNADKLHAIYMSLSERVQGNLLALGGQVDGMQGEEADTSNVWNMEPSFILMQQAPFNVIAYDISPDSTFQDGDRLTLQFDTQFIFQDGYRDVAAFIAVYYDNDSIQTSVTHVSGDGHGIVTLSNDRDRLHVKQIKGYFYLGKNLNAESTERNATTMRLVAVRNVKLLHTHTEPPAPLKEVEKTDSVKVDSVARKDNESK